MELLQQKANYAEYIDEKSIIKRKYINRGKINFVFDMAVHTMIIEKVWVGQFLELFCKNKQSCSAKNYRFRQS